MSMPIKSELDMRIASILSTKVQVNEPCVFVNCSRSLPQLRKAYSVKNIPSVALKHALCQSWQGIKSVCTENNSREIVFAHERGVIQYVVHAREWTLIYGGRIIFELNWLPKSHPYILAHGLDISPALRNIIPNHSAFLFQ